MKGNNRIDIQETESKLKEMKLYKMAEQYENQRNDPLYFEKSFDDRFYELVSKQYDRNYNRTVERLIKDAEFKDDTADLNEINYKPERKLDKGVIESLKTNDYISKRHNIIITGATGCGKSWLSCALGKNACQDRIHVKYYRLPELLTELEAQKMQNQYRDFLKKLLKYDLLILDDFLLVDTNQNERSNLLEIIESRVNVKSTIFCSQWTPSGWHEKLGGGPLADAILDRIINSSYFIDLKGNSLREDYSEIRR